MSAFSLSRILVPPGHASEAKGSWELVEQEIGTQLPWDYKEFVYLYGSGRIDDFIFVYNPFSSYYWLNLLTSSKEHCDALRYLREGSDEYVPFNIYPEPGGLLPVAQTDNGDIIHWLTRGAPSKWEVVVNETRSPDFERFNMSLTVLLERLLLGSIEPHALPKLSQNARLTVEH